MRPEVALATLLLLAGIWLPLSSQPSPAGACQDPGGFLLVEHGDGTALIDPASFATHELPLDLDLVRVAERARDLLTSIVPGRWHVERTPEEDGLRIEVIDRRSDAQVFDVSFARRIELAASAVSPSGRLTVHVQANNVASEVTLLDAQTGVSRRVDVPHDARLAAYTIGVAFSPDERCVAISMERVGGEGAETWLVDPESDDVLALPAANIFVVAWRPDQVWGTTLGRSA
ncbi:MAG: hypothetical protein H0T72_00785 [Chloroflexia bacterium]|nr:hypothetical protein [Chloroflexia bacterium]